MKYTKWLGLGFSMVVALLCACSEDSPSEPKDTFDANVVCPAEGTNAYGEPNRGTFTDERDGQVYKYTTIGNQVWMAENLKFDAPYSLCYAREENFCETFGRFYTLYVNGEYYALIDQVLADTICPAGWHVPSVDEWNELANNVGEGKKGSARLKSSNDFGEYYNSGSDDCSFNALPAGSWMLNGELSGNRIYAIYWTSTRRSYDTMYAYNLGSQSIEINRPRMTIRCLKN
ncbi:FISUMP domain-containing protein [Fibrobacter sp. UWH6]|uniref:FISUMP domain-containing protein n=1 Tax=Fibrobacter sp. (strain UWH6) TaxID=1896212 RepID=UPI0009244858|nr:FISUMP domain-containing protein [Fibrobacter sp. UWH6]SHL90050.1 major paralogous domain-containing protein [Fibrobacter sp. UWH6]